MFLILRFQVFSAHQRCIWPKTQYNQQNCEIWLQFKIYCFLCANISKCNLFLWSNL